MEYISEQEADNDACKEVEEEQHGFAGSCW
jgi:hypothetical protein